MCGIVGVILRGDLLAAPLLHEGLKGLEYRGYDSCGIATAYGGKVHIKKDSGKIDEVHKLWNLDELPGNYGIAHTRWATHGAPSKINAHPHTDCSGKIALVHNGVIENFLELKKELIELRHDFKSKTDTEVIAHLVEENIKRGYTLLKAVHEAIKKLSGSYALAIIYAEEPSKIVCVRNETPLILGLGDGAIFCASDVTAFLKHTPNVIFLENGEIAELTAEGYHIYTADGLKPISRLPTKIEWTWEVAEKSGYPHFMLKEIHEQPLALRGSLRLYSIYLDLLTELIDKAKHVFLVAAGTSYHACIAASYMFSRLANFVTFPVVASEFVESYGPCVGADTTILAVSQSGETLDVLKALEFARLRGATMLGITNALGSTLTRVVPFYLLQNSGPEVGVAATKTFTSQLLVLARLAMNLARKRGKLGQSEADRLREELRNLPTLAEHVLRVNEKRVRDLAVNYLGSKYFVFLGRGISTATAMEGRLKLMELTYVPSLAYGAGESKHGPISVIEKGTPVFFICPKDETRKAIIGNIMEMKARGADIIALASEDDDEIMELSNHFIPMPPVHPTLSPIPYVIPLQLFAYYSAVERGLDPDKPRALAKSVTVP